MKIDLNGRHPRAGRVSAWPNGYFEARYASLSRLYDDIVGNGRRRRRTAYRIARRLTDEEYWARRKMVEQKIQEALDQGMDTQAMYRNEFGDWDPERDRAHQEILDAVWERLTKNIPRDRLAVILGGASGSGKSTLLKTQGGNLGFDPNQYLVIDPDMFKEELIKRGLFPQIEGLSPLEHAPLIHRESSYLADRLAKRAMREGYNVAFDGTMSNIESAQKRLDLLNEYGYSQPHGVFVDVPIDVSKQRATDRHRKALEAWMAGENPLGGRLVPDSVIEKMASPDPNYWTVNRLNFEQLRPNFATSQVWDTSDLGNIRRVDFTDQYAPSPDQDVLLSKSNTDLV